MLGRARHETDVAASKQFHDSIDACKTNRFVRDRCCRSSVNSASSQLSGICLNKADKMLEKASLCRMKTIANHFWEKSTRHKAKCTTDFGFSSTRWLPLESVVTSMKSLLNYIRKYSSSSVSEHDFEIIRSHFSSKRLRKKQYFLQEGEVCKHFAFIVKGAMRQYYVDEKGAEHFVQLAIENWWVGDRESWAMLTPSRYTIDAWEDSEILLIAHADVLKLSQQFPALMEMMRKMDERNNIAAQKRITSAISYTAERRYADFVCEHPDLAQRFPQHVIASYIGITKDTLSRLRKQPS